MRYEGRDQPLSIPFLPPQSQKTTQQGGMLSKSPGLYLGIWSPNTLMRMAFLLQILVCARISRLGAWFYIKTSKVLQTAAPKCPNTCLYEVENVFHWNKS